ncbi:carbohydrate ABC transporter permease [Clostridium sp. Marseille-P2415]|uniref:carbohydrate ABC transporter permease n=1 Tax=Clostridium sp. Marseille-P2415 TaxID=1805471 RepID=UPI000988880B|nr:sugar ABC transporter permease [Clostridium sp. Marseille-P2415]
MVKEKKAKTRKKVSYSKWGYIFLIPFFATYFIFSFIPLVNTFYNSLFENYRSGLTQIGPNFVGLQNYVSIFQSDLLKYMGNTMILWIIGFIPQIIISLILAVWFADFRLRLKGSSFFKTVIYLPNVIMAASFAMLFFALFSDDGPMNNLLIKMGIANGPIRFLATVWGTRGLIGLMNFMMWFGNTTILLMAAILGVDASLFEAASIDGATSLQTFTKITMPTIKPIFIYVLITSLIGGLQMFDVPQVLTNAKGSPDRTSTTLIMFLNNHLYSKNYGMAGALSVILFIITAILSLIVFYVLTGAGKKKGGLK